MWWGNGSVVGHSCCHAHTRMQTHTRVHTHPLGHTDTLGAPTTGACTIIIFVVETVGWAESVRCWDLIKSQQVLVFDFCSTPVAEVALTYQSFCI